MMGQPFYVQYPFRGLTWWLGVDEVAEPEPEPEPEQHGRVTNCKCPRQNA
ncbi:hypothetical protein ALQ56_200407 [Pseudomonas syringae pv. papulans]|nr:hypothetical protein ALQ56_200407 [Pseudomonas syringae pv. papulans]